MDTNALEILDSFPHGVFGPVSSTTTTTTTTALPDNMNNDNKRSHDDALINALQISSQLARHSEQFFAALTKVYTIYKLGYILTNDNPVIRAKGCNLIGNLCRHSDRFYTVLVTKIHHGHQSQGQSHSRNTSSLLDLLCNCCGDSDPNTRKFASFAGAS